MEERNGGGATRLVAQFAEGYVSSLRFEDTEAVMPLSKVMAATKEMRDQVKEGSTDPELRP